ncbi:MAG: hypothetical protein COU90_00350 [Candidatus Ryanbacteria bacterium CG10_big_fil_rev_8_21_14_0_10_43_42]|uniref:Uncharacterized protein n=1 Tax=Candidatus Ryanbacteria bacterium CG10_big_fil_rev_8_21_14_0_10_43_42 TaxID=1974864 RepID=A0A2M8KXU2_9BACT|nr:MAG: hypothetical protein COU90_00350 [Candidatus Ryanbacteria bacterium CG10_big_fil_rev_8_21_14_0_10_43_42]
MIKKNLVFIIIVLALIGGGIAWYVSRPSPEDFGGVVPVGILPGTPSANSQFAEVRNKILQNIALLQRVRLDTTILDDPAFLSLEDAPEPPPRSLQIKRRNPFLPIGQ